MARYILVQPDRQITLDAFVFTVITLSSASLPTGAIPDSLPLKYLKNKPKAFRKVYESWTGKVTQQINGLMTFKLGEESVSKSTVSLEPVDFVWPSVKTALRDPPSESRTQSVGKVQVPAWSILESFNKDPYASESRNSELGRWKVDILESDRIPQEYFRAILRAADGGRANANEVTEFGRQMVEVLNSPNIAKRLVTSAYKNTPVVWPSQVSCNLEAALHFIYDVRLDELKKFVETWKASNLTHICELRGLKDVMERLLGIPLSVDHIPIQTPAQSMMECFRLLMKEPNLNSLTQEEIMAARVTLHRTASQLNKPLAQIRRAIGLCEGVWAQAVSVANATRALETALDKSIQLAEQQLHSRPQLKALFPHLLRHTVARFLTHMVCVSHTQRTRFQGLAGVAELGQLLVADGHGARFYELMSLVSRCDILWHMSPHSSHGIKLEGNRKLAVIKQFPNDDCVPIGVVLENLDGDLTFKADSTKIDWIPGNKAWSDRDNMFEHP